MEDVVVRRSGARRGYRPSAVRESRYRRGVRVPVHVESLDDLYVPRFRRSFRLLLDLGLGLGFGLCFRLRFDLRFGLGFRRDIRFGFRYSFRFNFGLDFRRGLGLDFRHDFGFGVRFGFGFADFGFRRRFRFRLDRRLGNRVRSYDVRRVRILGHERQSAVVRSGVEAVLGDFESPVVCELRHRERRPVRERGEKILGFHGVLDFSEFDVVSVRVLRPRSENVRVFDGLGAHEVRNLFGDRVGVVSRRNRNQDDVVLERLSLGSVRPNRNLSAFRLEFRSARLVLFVRNVSGFIRDFLVGVLVLFEFVEIVVRNFVVFLGFLDLRLGLFRFLVDRRLVVLVVRFEEQSVLGDLSLVDVLVDDHLEVSLGKPNHNRSVGIGRGPSVLVLLVVDFDVREKRLELVEVRRDHRIHRLVLLGYRVVDLGVQVSALDRDVRSGEHVSRVEHSVQESHRSLVVRRSEASFRNQARLVLRREVGASDSRKEDSRRLSVKVDDSVDDDRELDVSGQCNRRIGVEFQVLEPNRQIPVGRDGDRSLRGLSGEGEPVGRGRTRLPALLDEESAVSVGVNRDGTRSDVYRRRGERGNLLLRLNLSFLLRSRLRLRLRLGLAFRRLRFLRRRHAHALSVVLVGIVPPRVVRTVVRTAVVRLLIASPFAFGESARRDASRKQNSGEDETRQSLSEILNLHNLNLLSDFLSDSSVSADRRPNANCFCYALSFPGARFRSFHRLVSRLRDEIRMLCPYLSVCSKSFENVIKEGPLRFRSDPLVAFTRTFFQNFFGISRIPSSNACISSS